MILFLGPLLAVLAKIGMGAAKVGGAAAKAGGAAKGLLGAGGAGAGGLQSKAIEMLGSQFGQAAASRGLPQFGGALSSSLPAQPSVAGGIDLAGLGGSQSGLLQSAIPQAGGQGGGMLSSLRGENVGLIEKILGQKGSDRRAITKDLLNAYASSQGGSGGAGGGSPGGDMGPPPPMAVSVPPSTYTQGVPGSAEGFGGAGQALAPLLPKAGLSAEPSDEERRILALQLAVRSLGGNTPGVQGLF